MDENSIKPNDEISHSHNELSLKHPFIFVVSGPTGSGKTSHILKFLSKINLFSSPRITNIIYVYSEDQNIFKSFECNVPIKYTKDFKKMLDYTPKKNERPLLIYDDVQRELSNSPELLDLITKKSHHRGISVIIQLQNLFFPGKNFHELRHNAHYIGLTKSRFNLQKIKIFASQLFGGGEKVKDFISAYEDCMKENYSLFFIDLHPDTTLNFMYRANPFSDVNQYWYFTEEQKKAI